MSQSQHTSGNRSRAGSLDIHAPAATGALIVVGLAGGLALALASDRLALDNGFTIADVRLAERKVYDVRHPGGVIGKVHVQAGQTVAAGDLLATIDAGDLDAGDLDARIAALKAKSDAAQSRLESLRRETQAFNTMLEQRLVSRAKVVTLEAQLADVEREAYGVLARIAEAEQQLAQVEIHAPAGGVLRSAAGLVAGRTVASGEKIAEIAPDPDRQILEGRLSASQLRAAKAGTDVKVWFDAASWLGAKPLPARLVWIEPVMEKPAPGQRLRPLVRIELQANPDHLAHTRTLKPGMRAAVVLRDSRRSLLQQLLDPIRRVAGRSSHV